MSDVKIKPCPFCGDTYIRLHTSMKDKREGYYTIGCNTVNCIGLHCNGKLYKTKTEAVEAWNRRANDER